MKDSRVRNNGVRRGRRKEWSERVVCYINCDDCKRVEDRDRWNFGAMTQKEFAKREEGGLFSESCSVGDIRAFYFKCDCKKCWEHKVKNAMIIRKVMQQDVLEKNSKSSPSAPKEYIELFQEWSDQLKMTIPDAWSWFKKEKPSD